jgi:multicomponent Na+:H+ antiporter subunit D
MLVLPFAITWLAAIMLAVLDGRKHWVGWLAAAAQAAALGALIWLAVDVIQHGSVEMNAGDWPAGIGITLRADALGVTFALLSLSVILVATIYEVIGGARSRVFPALTCFIATGLTGIFLTGDAFNFYVFFEISMTSSYVLAGYGERTRQLRAATIFLTVNLLGSVLFLIAISGLYHLTGTLDMRQMAGRIALVEDEPAILIATLIFVAFSVKLGLFPFHFWLAAVYTGTRPAVAAILSGALANIRSYGLLRFGGEILPKELERGAPMLLLLGSLSIVYGAVQALSCISSAETIAYSSIGQVGYIMIALAVGGDLGFRAAVVFTAVNAMNKTLLFLTVPLRGWLVGAAAAVGAFSVAGVPPAAGFFGKVSLFQAAIENDHPYVLAMMVVGSLLSFVYMFQLYNQRFWEVDPTDGGAVASFPARRGLVFIVALIILGFGIWPEPLLMLSERAAQVLP